MAIINLKIQRKSNSDWGFLDDYLHYTAKQESPTDFHLWVAITLVATALGRKVYLDRYRYKLYPNLFTVLVAESGKLGKSTALGIGKSLLQKAIPDYPVFAQKGSSESMISFLNEEYKTKQESIALLFASEFSVFFGKVGTDPSILYQLTDWYDCPETWMYHTVGRGKEFCKKIGISMMAGTTPEWIRNSLSEDSLTGGFGGRLLFVAREETDKRPNPFPERDRTPTVQRAEEACIADLQTIHDLRGEFHWDKTGEIAYEDWYHEVYIQEDNKALFRGYYTRKRDTLIKIAMVVSAMRGDSLIINGDDITKSIKILSDNERYLNRVAELIGQTEQGKKNMKVLALIAEKGSLPRAELTHRLSGAMDKNEIDLAVATLIQGGQIRLEIVAKDTGRSQSVYHVVSK